MNHLSVYHPGFQHSGNIGDGSCVKCCACGEMVDCYVHEGPSGDETKGHILVCPWVLPAGVCEVCQGNAPLGRAVIMADGRRACVPCYSRSPGGEKCAVILRDALERAGLSLPPSSPGPTS